MTALLRPLLRRLPPLLCTVVLALAPGAEAAPWFDGARPGPLARSAVALLEDAASHGLDPDDYAAATLRAAVDRAASGPAPEPARVARVEAALDAAMRRLLADIHDGRVDPRTLHPMLELPQRAPFDARAALDAGLAAGSLSLALQRAQPPLPQYAALRDVLLHYRGLAEHPAWSQPLAPLPQTGRSRKLEPGAAWSGLPRLAQRLAALGDLPDDAVPGVPVAGAAPVASLAASAPAPAPVYAEPLVSAVRRFQQRHGLTPDGVIGAGTFSRLEVKPAARVAQLGLALERLRWTPLLQEPRMIVVNLPEFVLRAYEVRDGRIELVRAMKVIVGKAIDQKTPLIDVQLRAIEFAPYWNVPLSIARKETVPKLRRDPGYLDRQGFEFVAGDGSVHTGWSEAALDAVAAGRWRIRQRPGPQNALGDIKFVMPNSEAIYLHHTPSVGLFQRDRRDFSHGCVRVEDPVALAMFVLQGTPDWPEQRIRDAMAGGQSTTIRVRTPVRVLIAYGTALVKDGGVHFFDDVYRQDPRLAAALRERPSAVPALD